MKKSNKKIKINRKDLDKFSPERILKDFDSVNSVINQINNFDENLSEDDALNLQTELQQIESYLKGQYKDYINSNIKNVNLNDIDVELYDEKESEEESEENLDSEE